MVFSSRTSATLTCARINKPKAKPMAITFTFEFDDEDGRKLDEAFLAGKLAELGVTKLVKMEPSRDGKSWVETELKRDDNPPGKDDPAR